MPNDRIRLLERWRSQPLVAWGVILSVILTFQSWKHRYDWEEAQGFEPTWLAENLAEGRGYTLGQHLKLTARDGDATAWVEPVWPLLTAGAFRAFGRHWGRFAIVTLQTALVLGTALALAALGSRLGSTAAGMVAGLLVVLNEHILATTFGQLVAAPASGLLVTATALVALWVRERPSVARGAVLGAVIGLGLLTTGPSLLFLPLSLAMLLFSRTAQDGRRPSWKAALACTMVTLAVVSPWVARNFVVFRSFVPTRTGVGFVLHIGNPSLAATFVRSLPACQAPKRLASGAPRSVDRSSESGDSADVPWRANGPLDAILRDRSRDHEIALEQQSYDCISRWAPPGYDQMNEAQRDRVWAKRAFEFITREPLTFLWLTMNRVAAYFYAGWPAGVQLELLAGLVGLWFMRRSGAAIFIAALVLAYSVPYVITLPLYDRYRYPVEPLIALFAALAFVQIVARTLSREVGADRRGAGNGPLAPSGLDRS